jgi:acyl carrier protein
VQHEVRKFIVDNFMFGIADVQLSPDDSLIEKGLIDSTGILELIAFIEATYGISVADGELLPENLDSITALTRFIERKTKASVQQCS